MSVIDLTLPHHNTRDVCFVRRVIPLLLYVRHFAHVLTLFYKSIAVRIGTMFLVRCVVALVLIVVIVNVVYWFPFCFTRTIPAHTTPQVTSSSIPALTMFRTSRSRNVNSRQFALAYQEWVNMNPTLAIEWYNNADCDAFMTTQPLRVSQAYHLLKPGAYKADLFRLCVLYERGGVYVDAHAVPLVPIDDMLQRAGVDISEPHFVSVLDCDVAGGGVHNGFIIASKGHPLLKACIDLIVDNVEHRRYLNGPLEITGPLSMKYALNTAVARPPDAELQEGWNRFGTLSFYLFRFVFSLNQYIYHGEVPILYKKYSFPVLLYSILTRSRYEHQWNARDVYLDE